VVTYYSHDRVIISKRHGGYPVINVLVTCVHIYQGKLILPLSIVHSHIKIAVYFHDTYICVLVLHEIIYNAANWKHVYKHESHQMCPQFKFWGQKHNQTKVNNPLSVYFSSKCMIQIRWP